MINVEEQKYREAQEKEQLNYKTAADKIIKNDTVIFKPQEARHIAPQKAGGVCEVPGCETASFLNWQGHRVCCKHWDLHYSRGTYNLRKIFGHDGPIREDENQTDISKRKKK
ncbi:MAG: hypothetical protein ACTSQY_02765 [Candidatus Odinarchaeia archaeon]